MCSPIKDFPLLGDTREDKLSGRSLKIVPESFLLDIGYYLLNASPDRAKGFHSVLDLGEPGIADGLGIRL
jgi:hypothetical protein